MKFLKFNDIEAYKIAFSNVTQLCSWNISNQLDSVTLKMMNMWRNNCIRSVDSNIFEAQNAESKADFIIK